ncbi:hypothetical protein GYMLUDRAFT_64529 [Collybiopsis luxurians FD-317 M1]|uniref:Uncharacterized protein n=1 Tax=Collybiopsis luxurians FD-317 M1 TaxID=944289 RepID=A0A0D0BQM6_9AGAR|nr:hypothetical protein GYMLUDRAFT_64529 [Collybiopsis luxurians FD-317 M1]
MQLLLLCSMTFNPEGLPLPLTSINGRHIIIWYHNETIFYAHDRHHKTWHHKDSNLKLNAKGKGYTYDYFGFLVSPDGEDRACRIFKPGKNKDGYFTAEDIRAQANHAMDILTRWWPEYEYVFIYDNATTHLKWPDGSLSARKMPRGPSNTFFAEATEFDANRRPVYQSDGKLSKVKIRMGPAQFANGDSQDFYFPDGHSLAGLFKGMDIILQEHGIDTSNIKHATCKNFRCHAHATDCCVRRILFNQRDFVDVDSILETQCKERGFSVAFLPKFHCELNPIEQCWGGKMICTKMLSSLLTRFHSSLFAVSHYSCKDLQLEHIASWMLMLEAWASRKYRGHRVLPEGIMNELLDADIS